MGVAFAFISLFFPPWFHYKTYAGSIPSGYANGYHTRFVFPCAMDSQQKRSRRLPDRHSSKTVNVMKILLYCINFAPEQIGIGKFTGEMASWLVQRGHDVHVVSAPPYYPAWQRSDEYKPWQYYKETWQGVMVWRCPLWIPAKPKSFTRVVHLLSFALSSLLVMLCQLNWRPDIIVVVEPSLFCAPTALLVSQLCKSTAWLNVQDFEVEAFFGVIVSKSGFLKKVILSIESRLMKRFDHVSTISQAMLDRIHKLGVMPDRTSLFPNWVDTEFIRPERRDNALREAWGVKGDRKVVLYAGNMGRKQGLDIVLQIAYSLQDSRPDIVFFLVGDGAAKENLVAEAGRLGLYNVVFKPVQPLQSLPELLNLADIHLLIQKGGIADAVMPSKLTGIFAAGGASIITADAETELGKLVRNNPGIAVRVEPENPDLLLSAIVSLLDDQERRRAMGLIARRYAESNISMENVLSKIEEKVIVYATQR